jgi:hypothetical protein
MAMSDAKYSILRAVDIRHAGKHIYYSKEVISELMNLNLHNELEENSHLLEMLPDEARFDRHLRELVGSGDLAERYNPGFKQTSYKITAQGRSNLDVHHSFHLAA